MRNYNETKQIKISMQHRLGKHEEQPLLFFISTPNLIIYEAIWIKNVV